MPTKLTHGKICSKRFPAGISFRLGQWWYVSAGIARTREEGSGSMQVTTVSDASSREVASYAKLVDFEADVAVNVGVSDIVMRVTNIKGAVGVQKRTIRREAK